MDESELELRTIRKRLRAMDKKMALVLGHMEKMEQRLTALTVTMSKLDNLLTRQEWDKARETNLSLRKHVPMPFRAERTTKEMPLMAPLLVPSVQNFFKNKKHLQFIDQSGSSRTLSDSVHDA